MLSLSFLEIFNIILTLLAFVIIVIVLLKYYRRRKGDFLSEKLNDVSKITQKNNSECFENKSCEPGQALKQEYNPEMVEKREWKHEEPEFQKQIIPNALSPNFSHAVTANPNFRLDEESIKEIISHRGSLGELRLKTVLEQSFPFYLVFPDLYVPWAEGKYSQIDLVLLDPCAVFVFEVKDWECSPYGTEEGEWYYYSSRTKCVINNPITQNLCHIWSLQNFLPFVPKDRFISIIVFNNRCTFHVHTKTDVLHRNEVIPRLNYYRNSLPNVLSSNDIELAIDKLQPCCNVPEIQKQAHIKRVKIAENDRKHNV